MHVDDIFAVEYSFQKKARHGLKSFIFSWLASKQHQSMSTMMLVVVRPVVLKTLPRYKERTYHKRVKLCCTFLLT